MHPQLIKLFRVFLLSPLTFGVINVLIVVLCLNEVLRVIVSILLKIRFHGTVNLIQNGSDAVWTHKLKGTTRMVLTPLILKQNGNLQTENVILEVQKRIFGIKLQNKIYKKLKTIITTYFGFVCLKEDQNFNLKNHVRTLNPNQLYTEMDVTNLFSELCQDMDTTKPQWEIIIIQRFIDKTDEREEKVLMIFRFHHTYMDGMSLLMLMNQLSDDFKYQINPLAFRQPIWKMTLYYFNALIFGSLHILKMLKSIFSTHWMTNSNTFGKKHFAWGINNISLEKLRQIRMESKATIPNILSLAFVQACQRILPKERLVKNIEIGEVIAFLPYPNSKPQNRFTFLSYSVPTSEVSTSIAKKLEFVKEDAIDSMRGSQPLVDFYTCSLLGRLPNIIWPFFISKPIVSFYLSNVPCTRHKFSVFQTECKGIGAFPPCFTSTGIMIATLHYGESLSICCAADSSWLTHKELNKIFEELPLVLDELAEAVLPLSKQIDQFSDNKIKISTAQHNDSKIQFKFNGNEPHPDNENQNFKKNRIRNRQ